MFGDSIVNHPIFILRNRVFLKTTIVAIISSPLAKLEQYQNIHLFLLFNAYLHTYVANERVKRQALSRKTL